MAKKKLKTFNFHWGNGHVAEEVQVETQYHKPTIQLLEYTDGDAAGSVSVRFCSYTLKGGFSRSPLMVSEADLEALRKELAKAPRLKKLLAGLVN